jgi:dihydrofolate synthase/folylpolyglutamate synthase
LTYFEFGTLAAIDIFQRAQVQIAILEVGLGGRLDAVNVLDADLALITAIDIDHENWLGADREIIAREKAGILRAGQTAVCSDLNPPMALVEYADKLATFLFLPGRDFEARLSGDHWHWRGTTGQVLDLPLPALPGHFQVHNAAGVLAVVEQLYECSLISKPVSYQEITLGLKTVSLSGRFQVIKGAPLQILDVAHNPQSACALAENLQRQPVEGKTRAVLAMLADKDIAAVVASLRKVVDRWYLASLDVPRGATSQQLEAVIDGGQDTLIFDDVASAYQAAMSDAEPSDRIVIFGSFYTVAEVLSHAV